MYPELTSLMLWLVTVGAYLLGSISTATITAKLMNLPDPRTQGSGNPGATNMLRVGGKKAGLITLLGDGLKGTLPVVIAHTLGFDSTALVMVGCAAFLGHLYPVFYGFQGGKGVATALGVYIGLHFWAALLVIGTWLVVAKLFNYSSLAALVATLLAPIYFFIFTQQWSVFLGLALMTGFIYWRHQANIKNLRNGTEKKIKT